ncbi:fucose permease [Povalibacter uvarum]|uniref:Fucose permease n=1 Tax=Povalibacter uvarum TaxID=732238 RepID=A0A841HP37_9GAMM|nr:MFS transporter [Povalibacter uvarum]MBB6093898.1 fucose permease [Povalibacter uvarum]
MHARFLIPLVLCFAGFVALGLPDAVIGVAWPAIRADFGLSIDALGPLFVTATTGAVIASSCSGVILSRMSIGTLLALSCFLTGIALLGYTLVPMWSLVVALGLLTGFGAGAIDAAINTHAAVQYSARVVNVLHAFYAVGAAAGPALMTATLASGHQWQAGYWIIVAVQIAMAALFLSTRRLWPRAGPAHESQKPARLIETLKLGKVQLSLVIFMIYTGCEAGAGAWIFSLLYEARGVATVSAGTAVTLYWVGLFASRLGYAFLPSRVRPTVVIGICIATALVGMIVVALQLHPLVDTAAIALIGFASGPIFPSMIATTPARVGSQHTANAVGLQISVGAIGIAALPGLCGVSAQKLGLESIPVLLIVGWTVLLVAYSLLERLRPSVREMA